MKKYLLISLLALFGMMSCGGGDSLFDNPPNVEGDYSCTDNCVGDCTFDLNISVVQDDENIIVKSDFFDDASGTIDDNGDFDVESDSCKCDGTFVDNTAVARCTCDNEECQSVTYTKDENES